MANCVIYSTPEGKPFDKSRIDWNNQSYDEFCDILEDAHGIEIKRK